LSLHTLTEGQTVRLPFLIRESDLQAFSELSGDLNPVHLDAAYARSHGFKGKVVYGGLYVAAVSRLLGMKLPGKGSIWHSLSIQFKSPLYVDEDVEVVGTVIYINHELRVLRLALEVKRNDELLARGEAQAGWLPEGPLP
jgi:acyl dehydratase